MTSDSGGFEIDSVSKRYGKIRVLKDVSFKISASNIVLLLGANGAGKSTLLKICASLLRPDGGTTKYQGNVNHNFCVFGAYLGHQSMLYQELTVKENLAFMSKIRALNLNIAELLREWNLTAQENNKISELSRGLQFRTALCASLMHQPRVIFLDEPTSSLDQNSFNKLITKITTMVKDKNGLALIATHDIERLLPAADRIIVLKEGKLTFDSDSVDADLEEKKNQATDYYHRINC